MKKDNLDKVLSFLKWFEPTYNNRSTTEAPPPSSKQSSPQEVLENARLYLINKNITDLERFNQVKEVFDEVRNIFFDYSKKCTKRFLVEVREFPTHIILMFDHNRDASFYYIYNLGEGHISTELWGVKGRRNFYLSHSKNKVREDIFDELFEYGEKFIRDFEIF